MKGRTNRTVLSGDFSDKQFPTSFDWPADLYVLVKLLCQKRKTTMNQVLCEAMRQWIVNQPEFKELYE